MGTVRNICLPYIGYWPISEDWRLCGILTALTGSGKIGLHVVCEVIAHAVIPTERIGDFVVILTALTGSSKNGMNVVCEVVAHAVIPTDLTCTGGNGQKH